MKIFVVLSRFPYPLEKGDKLRAYHQIKELSKQHQIYLAAISDIPIEPQWKQELEKFCVEVHTFRLYKPIIYLNLLIGLFGNKPLQTYYFHSRIAHKKINRLIKIIQPNHLYCQLIRTTEYIKNIQHIPKTLDYQDALSHGMFSQAKKLKGFSKKIHLLEAKRLSAYENRIFDYFNFHTIISEQDKDCISHPQKEKIVVIKNGIDNYFLNYQNTINKPEFDCVFVGNLSYEPNVRCVEFIAHELVPLLNKEIKILIAGANPNTRVKNCAGPQISITGWVDDIRTAYCNAKVFIAPLFIGTGLQNKLLEAMALQKTCITTSLVNERLGAENHKQILIADSAEAFKNCIEQILNDEKLSQQIALEGHQFIKENYSWEKSTALLSGIFK